MRLFRPLAGGFVGLILFGAAARAESPADPLRFVPQQAEGFIEVKNPRGLIEAGLSTDVFKTLYALPPIHEVYDSTKARRFYQLVGYFEKELGAKWPDLLDKLAGGGMVVATRFGDGPQPVLLVIQGTDAELMGKFYRTSQDIIAQELAREDVKAKIEKRSYKNVETIHLGPDACAARIGATLLVSNKEEGLKSAIDTYRDGGKKSLAELAAVKDSAKLLPGKPLARAWLNLENLKQNAQAKEVFTSPRNDAQLTILFGGQIDVATRSSYLCLGLYQEKDGFRLALRLPAGRDGASPDFALHVPPADGPGLLPLLEPKGVLYSSSFYMDLSKIWNDRTKLFNPNQVKLIEEADKNTAARLVGLTASKVLTQAGARHRVVAVDQPKPAYKDAPTAQPIPAFAFITEMRDPEEFSKSMDASLRAGALLAGSQYKLKMTEEKHGDYKIVGWRFPVDVKLESDTSNIRFNFSPCYVRVRNQFVFCSTLELCHELVDMLDRETKEKLPKGHPGASQSRVYGSGGAGQLRSLQDILVTQFVLDQAITPEAAREQVKSLIDLVQKSGTVEIDVVYGAKQFGYDIRWKMGK